MKLVVSNSEGVQDEDDDDEDYSEDYSSDSKDGFKGAGVHSIRLNSEISSVYPWESASMAELPPHPPPKSQSIQEKVRVEASENDIQIEFKFEYDGNMTRKIKAE
jgi:hypothetical protein